MQYDLWDTETRNWFGHFEDEREVLSLVRTLITHYGDQYASELGLGRVTDDGEVLEPLSGAALIARVTDVLTAAQSAGAPLEVITASSTRR